MLRSMLSRTTTRVATFLVLTVGCAVVVGCAGAPAGGGSGAEAPPPVASTSYNDLLALFEEWREFQPPRWVDGIPDYSAQAMAAQHAELPAYQAQLAAIDPNGWPAEQQIDHVLVGAEMNGLDFDHRVRRPWAENPAFYVTIFAAQSDVPAHEGPVIDGWIDLWADEYPLADANAAALAVRIGSIPSLLDQARRNLTGNGHDLWAMSPGSFAAQSADLAALATRVAGTSTDLDGAIQRATEATDEFRAWLDAEVPSKTGPSGVGADNYTWYLQNVHLVPYTWEEEVTIMRRELARSHASLRLEENRNRDLPALTRVDSAEQYDRVFNAAVDEYMDFLEEEEIMTVRGYMDAALRARNGSFSPADGLRGFFSEVSYRDAVTMRTHSHHWIELATMVEEPHESPIRRVPSLFNIYDARSEGLATGMEEMMMHAGLFDDRPQARELIWILLAQRAARAIGGLMMHANEYTMQEAVDFASEWTPRGWMPDDSATVWGEQHLYLTQPGYGTSYIIGKIQIEQLLAERALQLGDEFTLQRFMDEFFAAGVIPVSLVRWQLTGDDENIRHMLELSSS